VRIFSISSLRKHLNGKKKIRNLKIMVIEIFLQQKYWKGLE